MDFLEESRCGKKEAKAPNCQLRSVIIYWMTRHFEKEKSMLPNFHCVFRTEKEQLKATAGYIYGGIEEDELIFCSVT